MLNPSNNQMAYLQCSCVRLTNYTCVIFIMMIPACFIHPRLSSSWQRYYYNQCHSIVFIISTVIIIIFIIIIIIISSSSSSSMLV